MDGRRKSVSEWRCTAKMNGKIWLKMLDSKSSGCSDQHKLLNGQAHCHLFSGRISRQGCLTSRHPNEALVQSYCQVPPLAASEWFVQLLAFD